MKRELIKFVTAMSAASALLVVTQGCARVPAGANLTGGRLIVSMTVAGQINPNDFYFVLFDATNSATADQGPIPVVAPPWGNGFAAGQFGTFVRIDSTQPNGGYGVYAVIPNTNLQTFQYLGSPIAPAPVSGGTSQIQFTIPLSQLATAALPQSQITFVKINFITTDRVPTNPNDTTPKEFDALGDARIPTQVNDPITIPVTQSGTFDNTSSLTPEPAGDVTQCGNGIFQSVSNNDLDIVNWSVQVVP